MNLMLRLWSCKLCSMYRPKVFVLIAAALVRADITVQVSISYTPTSLLLIAIATGRAMGGAEDTIDAEVAAGSALSAVLTTYPKILIAAVHGASIGWGCTQLSSFDLIYAHQSAFFQTPFASLGIVPEGGSSYNFPKAMGKARANALLLAGDRLTAHQAWVGGLITGVVEAESVDTFLNKVLAKTKIMGTYSAEALQMAKRLTMDAVDDMEARRRAGERERRDILIRFAAPDTKEILAAFGGGKAKSKM
jgi:peroxisomal 3,2-trans-enoyl-CoA isomerase